MSEQYRRVAADDGAAATRQRSAVNVTGGEHQRCRHPVPECRRGGGRGLTGKGRFEAGGQPQAGIRTCCREQASLLQHVEHCEAGSDQQRREARYDE
jgi:hypothetical protein